MWGEKLVNAKNMYGTHMAMRLATERQQFTRPHRLFGLPSSRFAQIHIHTVVQLSWWMMTLDPLWSLIPLLSAASSIYIWSSKLTHHSWLIFGCCRIGLDSVTGDGMQIDYSDFLNGMLNERKIFYIICAASFFQCSWVCCDNGVLFTTPFPYRTQSCFVWLCSSSSPAAAVQTRTCAPKPPRWRCMMSWRSSSTWCRLTHSLRHHSSFITRHSVWEVRGERWVVSCRQVDRHTYIHAYR